MMTFGALPSSSHPTQKRRFVSSTTIQVRAAEVVLLDLGSG